MTIEWIELETILAIHDFQISAHGGASGVRDIGLVESALNKPRHMLNYGSYDIIDLAAAYGFSLAKNHGFIDGNKRTAYVVTRLFLRLHHFDFKALPVERVFAFEKLGKGDLSQTEFTKWLRDNCKEKRD
ncbi:MAG: type II toxin-antitoxin system death-on-curing family toxin [Desulfobacteraceae bacterium]|jgi:death-on-curing protein|nr:type II toxin-antitoxin system death-on-curing family toxin [Desulfobacteraceae bacterium]